MKIKQIRLKDTILLIFLSISFTACQSYNDNTRPTGWTQETHSKDVVADYTSVFKQNSVSKIELKFNPQDWQEMLGDVADIYGDFNSTASVTTPQIPQQVIDACSGKAVGDACSFTLNGQNINARCTQAQATQPLLCGNPPSNDQNLSVALASTRKPIYKPCEITFEGKKWEHVGVRFKGNSTLKRPWLSGSLKLSLRLNFDKFENEYQSIHNQRFYGFKNLALANNWLDKSLLREKISADIFRNTGVPAPQTAFYEVYIDFGKGSTYFGLYTMIEIPDKPMFNSQFTNTGNTGNLYKPTSKFKDFNKTEFYKKNNEKENNFEDVKNVISKLNQTPRDLNWKNSLESVLNVDGFLKWLATNTVIQNWDTYGNAEHNYYLYTNPQNNLVTWIPWDNNMALTARNTPKTPLSLDLNSTAVNESWPLIRFLMDDPQYAGKYKGYVKQMSAPSNYFAQANIIPKVREQYNIIKPFVVRSGKVRGFEDMNASEFDQSINEMIGNIVGRHNAISQY